MQIKCLHSVYLQRRHALTGWVGGSTQMYTSIRDVMFEILMRCINAVCFILLRLLLNRVTLSSLSVVGSYRIRYLRFYRVFHLDFFRSRKFGCGGSLRMDELEGTDSKVPG